MQKLLCFILLGFQTEYFQKTGVHSKQHFKLDYFINILNRTRECWHLCLCHFFPIKFCHIPFTLWIHSAQPDLKTFYIVCHFAHTQCSHWDYLFSFSFSEKKKNMNTFSYAKIITLPSRRQNILLIWPFLSVWFAECCGTFLCAVNTNATFYRSQWINADLPEISCGLTQLPL